MAQKESSLGVREETVSGGKGTACPPFTCPIAWDKRAREIPPYTVYNKLPAVSIDLKEDVPMETRDQADSLFAKLRPRGKKGDEKQAFFRNLILAAKRAVWANGCIMYSRNTGTTKRIYIQVVDSAVNEGLFREHRSPRGSRKMSRLLPLSPIVELFGSIDPWEFDPEVEKVYVSLRDRQAKTNLPVDWSKPIATEAQLKLTLINEVNSTSTIVYRPWHSKSQRQLRPIHRAIFTQHWEWNGRLHTTKYGHQNLSKHQRKTIKFDGEKSAELDYSGMHPRMLYHLEKIPFSDDPYALWDTRTTPEKRALAKKLINAAINVRSRTRAINACNKAMRFKNGDGTEKSGKSLRKAVDLYSAWKETGLSFAQIYVLALKIHHRIKHRFCKDYGVVLMRIESEIAIEILSHFAQKGFPCLTCHDSFIVPVSQKEELRRVMDEFYHRKMGFRPIVGE